jgi:tetratricopeptide (TPR) repeat protein
MSSHPGSLLSQRYEIREHVGSDGAVEVYRALDLRLGRDVALTVLEVHNLAGTDEYLRFEQEAQARAALQHPRIVTIHDFTHDATRIYLVAEWLEGESLRARLRRTALTWSQSRTLGLEWLDAISEIHAKGYALGNLTPASVFLEQDGHGKLFAYRLQKLDGGSAESYKLIQDLRNLAALLVQSLARPEGGPPLGREENRILQQLRLWAAGQGQVPLTEAALRELLIPKTASRWKQPLPWLAALLVLVATLSLAALPFFRRAPRAPRFSVALLPFENRQDPASDYLSPNLLHAVANELGRIPDIRIALAEGERPLGGSQDPLVLARHMGTDLVLAGNYRLEKGRLLVEARLLRTKDGSLFTRCRVERPLEEMLFLMTELEDQLRTALLGHPDSAPSSLSAASSRDPEAQRLCLQGLQLLENGKPGAFEKALACFQSALARDPSFALAYSGLSDTYCLMGCRGRLPRNEAQRLAEDSARKALGLDPALAQAHTALANARFRFSLDWMGAEGGFRQALRLDPNSSKAHQRFGLFLATLGHWEESLEHLRRALELEPLSTSIRVNYALDLHWAGRSQEAIQELSKVLDQDPSCRVALDSLWQIQEELGKIEEGLATARKLVDLGSLPGPALDTIRNAYEAKGLGGYWAQRIRQIEQERMDDTLRMAEVAALQGDKDRALRLLNRAFQERSPDLIYVPKDPALESLRKDARFIQILKQMKYPAV